MPSQSKLRRAVEILRAQRGLPDFDGTPTLADIAIAAGLSRPTLDSEFPGKATLDAVAWAFKIETSELVKIMEGLE